MDSITNIPTNTFTRISPATTPTTVPYSASPLAVNAIVAGSQALAQQQANIDYSKNLMGVQGNYGDKIQPTTKNFDQLFKAKEEAVLNQPMGPKENAIVSVVGQAIQTGLQVAAASRNIKADRQMKLTALESQHSMDMAILKLAAVRNENERVRGLIRTIAEVNRQAGALAAGAQGQFPVRTSTGFDTGTRLN